MNENIKLAVTIGFVSAVAIGGGLLNTRIKSSNPMPWLERERIAVKNQPRPGVSTQGRQQDQAIAIRSASSSDEITSPSTNSDADFFKDEKPSECDNRKIQHEVPTLLSGSSLWVLLR